MKRYTTRKQDDATPNSNGEFVLYSDVLKLVHPLMVYTLNHKEEIQADTDGFGGLKPLLDFINGMGRIQ